ncbi:MAG: HdeD family acid-resistance protein [Terriglobales bacterium]
MAEASVRSGPPGYELMIAVLAKNWWAIGMRGALGILFGLIALFLPGATMLSLVLVFAAYAFADGVFGIVSAVRAARAQERWGYLLLEGLVNIAVAAVAVLWPGITVVAFVFLVAFWAILTGVLELMAAFRLDVIDGRGWLIFGGVVSVLYGALLIVTPMIGAVVLTWWLGAYALVFGVSLVVLAFKLHARLEKH